MSTETRAAARRLLFVLDEFDESPYDVEVSSEPLRLRQNILDWREIDGEIVALDARSSSYVAANATGALLWRALAGGTTRQELAALLVREFGIDNERAEADVERFLAQLGDAGLLEG